METNTLGDIPGNDLRSQDMFWFGELLVRFSSTSEIERTVNKDLFIERQTSHSDTFSAELLYLEVDVLHRMAYRSTDQSTSTITGDTHLGVLVSPYIPPLSSNTAEASEPRSYQNQLYASERVA